MILEDDRTEQEKRELPILVIGTDSFLSGWGKAEGGMSYAAWACNNETMYRVERWVRNRPDMKRVRVTCGAYHPKGVGHCHIYAVHADHVSLQ